MTGRLCNLDRLVHAMDRFGLDGIVAATSNNVYWLSGFNAVAQKSDEPRPIAVVLSREAPESPVMVLPDYYLGSMVEHAGWIADIRPYRAVMVQFDLPSRGAGDLDRFVPSEGRPAWFAGASGHYADNMLAGLDRALRDLGLAGKRVGFDELRLGMRMDAVETRDGYGAMMSARAVKTDYEIRLLRAATAVNRSAIEESIDAWVPGMTWRDLEMTYRAAAVRRGGFVHDPGAMVLSNGSDSPTSAIAVEGRDFALESGMRIMFDCHGCVDLYCWDGGKTWLVGGEGAEEARPLAEATSDAMVEIEAAMRPGVRISDLQAIGRGVYRKHGMPGADDVLIFFHGLGLSHLDQEIGAEVEGSATGDFALEEGMLVATHILHPGSRRERMWLEDIALVGGGGPAESIFGWDFMPHGL